MRQRARCTTAHRRRATVCVWLALLTVTERQFSIPPVPGRPTHKVKTTACGKARKGDGLTANWEEVDCPTCLLGQRLAGPYKAQRMNSHLSAPLPAGTPELDAYNRSRQDADEAAASRVAERVSGAMKARRRRR